ncbi:MAG TPA: ACP S-malonyltransferase [Allosphingosinicella sp.]|jgi:[acyl-carrier-protein] S-malonyltransferase
MRAFIFPGQGSQSVGMGKALAEASSVARHLFEEVDEALSLKLFRLMVEGPSEELTLTENAQPAIMANAVATFRVSGISFDRADFVAGHSLGEYSALCSAFAFNVATTARLLRLRGQAMQRSVPVGEGAMAALLGVSVEIAQAVADSAAQSEVCVIANDNDPTQVVLSGHRGAVERALEIAKEKGARRAILLPVSAPFHSPLMGPAAREMEQALADVDFDEPCVPLYANVTAAPVEAPDEIRRLLVEQVTGMVRWRESVAAMAEAGVDHFVEFGGKVLGPMVKRIAPDSKVTSVVSMDDIDALVKEL